jgi:hypothetical protein
MKPWLPPSPVGQRREPRRGQDRVPVGASPQTAARARQRPAALTVFQRPPHVGAPSVVAVRVKAALFLRTTRAAAYDDAHRRQKAAIFVYE